MTNVQIESEDISYKFSLCLIVTVRSNKIIWSNVILIFKLMSNWAKKKKKKRFNFAPSANKGPSSITLENQSLLEYKHYSHAPTSRISTSSTFIHQMYTFNWEKIEDRVLEIELHPHETTYNTQVQLHETHFFQNLVWTSTIIKIEQVLWCPPKINYWKMNIDAHDAIMLVLEVLDGWCTTP